MEILGTDVSEARITALEEKVRDMEALAKGLINETLDLKSDVMTMSKEADEQSRQELKRGTTVRGMASSSPAGSASPSAAAADGSTTIRPRVAPRQDVPAAPPEPAMVLIMQSDGTMKMEPRCGDQKQTDSSGGYGPDRMPHLTRTTRTR